jgi:hypothetical protein
MSHPARDDVVYPWRRSANGKRFSAVPNRNLTSLSDHIRRLSVDGPNEK